MALGVGALTFAATVLPPERDEEIALQATDHHVFEDGMIGISIHDTLSHPDYTDATPTRELVQIVTGGTNAFTGAAGVVTSTTLDDGRRQIAYVLICD